MSIIGSMIYLIKTNQRARTIFTLVMLAGLFGGFGLFMAYNMPEPEPAAPEAPEPLPTPTPTPFWLPTPTPTPDLFVEVNETVDEPMTYCDDRLPANVLYDRGCTIGSRDGGGSAPQTPTSVVPELRCFGMLVIGLIGIWYITVKRS